LKISERICKGLTKPQFKLISQLIFGIFKSQDCKLSSIARALNEETTLKKTIERLSLFLKNFQNAEEVRDNYLGEVKKHIKDDTPLIIDDGDVVKPHGSKFEDLSLVRDGSTGKIEKGYASVGVVALTEYKLPIPIYERIYTSKNPDFDSENTETIEALDFLDNNFSKENIRVLDRGYDRGKIYKKLLETEVKFIVRADSKRNILSKGKEINILKFAQGRKTKFAFAFKKKGGVKADLRVAIVPIKLPRFPNEKLNLVVVKGFGKQPLMLITNLGKSRKTAETIAKIYILRWKIEEFYRLKKEGYNFEDFRVRNLNAIRNLSMILNFVLGILAIMGEKWRKTKVFSYFIQESKRIYDVAKFCLYALADGISALLGKIALNFCKNRRKYHDERQLSFFGKPDYSYVF